jgi:ribonuclease-3
LPPPRKRPTGSAASAAPQLEGLERRIGHRFARRALLEQALTHRSYGSPHNERLEFLGDGVLGCVVAAELCERFPDASEGELSRLRASVVREAALAEGAREVGLSEFLRLGEGEVAAAGAERSSTLADALEAVFGAAFLDGGYPAARAAIQACLGAALERIDPRLPPKDAKTRLQEYLQGQRRKLPRYRIASTSGAAHRQVFEVECVVEDLNLAARGQGRSRRSAEQRAAENLLKLLEA